MTKSGAGTMSVTVDSTYTGNTTVNAGTLDILNLNTPNAAVLVTGAETVLSASSIVSNTLTIGAGAKVVIKPLTGGQLSGAASLKSVPEPSTWAMLMLTIMGLGIYWRRSR
jgi:autotransporter-associated beta strand protein